MKQQINITLNQLVEKTEFSIYGEVKKEIVISSIEYDSRKVFPGTLFVAVKGFESDGHDYVESAVKNGAIAVLVEKSELERFSSLKDIVLLYCDDSRMALSKLSAAFYDFPSRKMILLGITGTNGKTSITYMIESVLKSLGKECGVIGTVNYRWKDKEFPAANTTPESRDLQKLLFDMYNDGVMYVVMEVSSHALDLDRVAAMDFDVCAFTNLTGDHLDFHNSMENYFLAKQKLFYLLEESVKKNKSAIVNIDDDYGKRIFDKRKSFSCEIFSQSLKEGADFYSKNKSIENSIKGLSYNLNYFNKTIKISLALAGLFHVYNSITAFAMLYLLKFNVNDIISGLQKLSTVPGRFDVIHSPLGFSVVVDYAHTGDALLKLLQSVNDLDHKRIITVFGCGGDRDKTKRPVMGKIAKDLSDVAIVTSDNPRTENPMSIIQDIVEPNDRSNYIIMENRKDAIASAIKLAKKDDIVVVAGKGHEDYQIIGKIKMHFDDREIVHKYIEEFLQIEG